MREIVYIQAGNFSNHIGTHFWNTQEAYFTYEDVGSALPDVNHDISFREGLARDGSATYCPRLLLFDLKSNFGPLGRVNDLYGELDVDKNNLVVSPETVQEIRQDPIDKSAYQQVLDREAVDAPQTADVESQALLWDAKSVRYWSDFSRVYYIPRTLHPIQQTATGDSAIGEVGRKAFERYNTEFEVMDTALRLFVEESDALQGFHVSFDTTPFGSFTLALLENIKDEYSKNSVLSFPSLSEVSPLSTNYHEVRAAFGVVQSAVILRDLALSVSTVTVPLQAPSTWNAAHMAPGVEFDPRLPYQASAILSAHIETATIDLRARMSPTNLAGLCSHLNWRNYTPISNLSGTMPLDSTTTQDSMIDALVPDFSTRLDLVTKHVVNRSRENPYAQRTTIRLDSADEISTVQDKIKAACAFVGLQEPLLSLSTYRSYPLPTSYPRFFKNVSSVPVLSTLTTTPTISSTLHAYASYVSKFIKQGDLSNEAWDSLDADELKEVAEDLIQLADCYGVEEAGEDEEADGEYEIDA